MKIALLGYGLETKSAQRYYAALYPDATFAVYDNADEPKFTVTPDMEFHGGMKDFHDIDADIVVRTPAIAPHRVSSRGSVTSVTKEFFDVCPVPIIGVTGTKGKGTTASLIAAILQKAGIKTWLIGNIGIPALDVIDEIKEAGDGVVVYELSSFQLWDMTKSPHVAVLLMIEAEHLDVHADFEDYIQAKGNIARHQQSDDAIVYFADNPITVKLAEESAGRHIPYYPETGESIRVHDHEIIKKTELQLPGQHNIGNVQAAVLAAWEFTQDISAIASAIREFKGLPHRLEEIAVKNGVHYINDSFSSAPPAVVVAVAAFEGPKIIIMGGYDRGLDFSETCKKIASQQSVKKVVLMGQNKDRIAQGFEKAQWNNYELVNDLEAAVKRAAALAQTGDTVLMSPASASFDMFKNFTERAEKFKALVAEL